MYWILISTLPASELDGNGSCMSEDVGIGRKVGCGFAKLQPFDLVGAAGIRL